MRRIKSLGFGWFSYAAFADPAKKIYVHFEYRKAIKSLPSALFICSRAGLYDSPALACFRSHRLRFYRVRQKSQCVRIHFYTTKVVTNTILCYESHMARYGLMSRKIKLSQEELAWLRGNHHSVTLHQLAKRYSVCIDTVKRLLVRHELQYFPGAKYQVKPSPKVWGRPCIACGCTTPRPKNQYMCDPCTSRGSGDITFKDVRATKKQPYTPKVPF